MSTEYLDLERYIERHPRTTDLVASTALFCFTVLGGTLSLPEHDQPDDLLPVALLAVVTCVVLLWHRSHPRTAVVVAMVCVATAGGLGYMLNPLLMAPVMASLYWLAALTDRRTTRIYLFVAIALLQITVVVADRADMPLVLQMLAPTIWVLLPVAAGSGARIRRAYLDAVQARADYAERSREEEARLRVAEERMRIARELHDVVAHHMALANAQAGTAAHLARSHPDKVQKILDDLAGTTSSALRELKVTVGLLRQSNDSDASLEPAPGLARLPELTAACQTAGIKVTVTTEGTPRPLSPGVDLTAFRIVQEALTNVTKHASAKAAYVELEYARDRLTLTVTDNGTATAPEASAAPAAGRGFGLVGMRERAQSVGGELCAGPRPQGGFEVTTTLPLHPQDARNAQVADAAEDTAPKEQTRWPSAYCSPTTRPCCGRPSES